MLRPEVQESEPAEALDDAPPRAPSEELLERLVTTPPTRAARRVGPLLRIGGLVLLVISGWTFLFATGLIDSFEETKVRAMVSEAGPYGVGLFFVAFVGAQLLHVPGSFLIAVASVAWGWALGAGIAWSASVIAITVNFSLVKTVGGDALLAINRPLVDKILRHLHRRPRTTVFVARALFMTSPWLATTLALAGVRQRDHLFPSAIGIVPQILIWTVGVDLLL